MSRFNRLKKETSQVPTRTTVDVRGISNQSVKTSAIAQAKYRACINSLPEVDNIRGLTIELKNEKEIRGISAAGDRSSSMIRPRITLGDPQSLTQGTINDIRMGSLSNDRPCGTCNLFSECVGHDGYIDLGTNILNPMVAKLGIRIASCICQYCYHLTFPISEEDDTNRRKEAILEIMESTGIINSFFEERISNIAKYLSVVNKCPRAGWSGIKGCRTELRRYTVTSVKEKGIIPYTLRGKRGEEASRVYLCHPDEFKDMFNGIPEVDVEILGIRNNCHRDIVTNVLTVIPPIYRQPVATPTGAEEDPITQAYINILHRCYDKDGKALPKSKMNVDDLYKQVYELMMSNKVTGNKNDGKKMRSIFSRLSSKTGLFRKNILGKRGDGAGRDVITCSEEEEFGEFGTPERFMKELYITEVLTPHNIAYYTAMIARGEITRYQTKNSPQGMRNYSNCNRDTQPRVGDIVFRPQSSDDYAIHNRQPSLHRQSMMAHRPRMAVGGTQFRLHRSDCTPYNADFDGDEMNLNTAQGKLTQAEAQYLMAAHRVGETPNSTNFIGLIGSITTAACHSCTYNFGKRYEKFYRLCLAKTRYCYFDENSDLPREEQFNLWMTEKYRTAAKFGITPEQGRLLFSFLLPRDFNYSNAGVEICEGILVKGAVSMDTVGPVKVMSIPQMLIYQYGDEVNRRFITDANFLYAYYNAEIFGFSIGIGDCIINPQVEKEIKQEVHNMYLRAEQYFSPVYDHEESESEIVATVQDYGNYSNRVARRVIDENYGNQDKSTANALKLMIEDAKSKGKIDNVKTMFINIGQQFIGSRRVIFALSGQRRFLPYFDDDDFSLDAGGFIRGNYTHGINPAEMFAGDICARDSSTDTTNRLPLIGDFQRQATRTLESLVVTESGTIMNSLGRLVDACYADGYLAEKLIRGPKGPQCIDTASYFNNLRSKRGIFKFKAAPEYSEAEIEKEASNQKLDISFTPRAKKETHPYLSMFEMTRIAAELANKLDESAAQRQKTRSSKDRMVTLAGYYPELTEEQLLDVSNILEAILNTVSSLKQLTEDKTKDRVKRDLSAYPVELQEGVAENLEDILTFRSQVRVPDIPEVQGIPNNMNIAPVLLDLYTDPEYGEEYRKQLNFEVEVSRYMPNGEQKLYKLNELEKPRPFVVEF